MQGQDQLQSFTVQCVEFLFNESIISPASIDCSLLYGTFMLRLNEKGICAWSTYIGHYSLARLTNSSQLHPGNISCWLDNKSNTLVSHIYNYQSCVHLVYTHQSRTTTTISYKNRHTYIHQSCTGCHILSHTNHVQTRRSISIKHFLSLKLAN